VDREHVRKTEEGLRRVLGGGDREQRVRECRAARRATGSLGHARGVRVEADHERVGIGSRRGQDVASVAGAEVDRDAAVARRQRLESADVDFVELAPAEHSEHEPSLPAGNSRAPRIVWTKVRILFTTTRGAGHVGPLVPFARACVRAGHDVLVAGPGGAGRLVRRAGLQFLPVGEPPEHTRAAAWAPVFSRAAAPGAPHVIRELFIGLDARAALPGMLAAVETWQPELIVRETCEFASCVAAERFGVPLAQVGIHLSSHTDAGDGLLAIAAPALEALGLEDVEAIGRVPVLTLAPRALDAGDAPAPSGAAAARSPAERSDQATTMPHVVADQATVASA
jgi:hypothetical protein